MWLDDELQANGRAERGREIINLCLVTRPHDHQFAGEMRRIRSGGGLDSAEQQLHLVCLRGTAEKIALTEGAAFQR
jgi:hypothetical protein